MEAILKLNQLLNEETSNRKVIAKSLSIQGRRGTESHVIFDASVGAKIAVRVEAQLAAN